MKDTCIDVIIGISISLTIIIVFCWFGFCSYLGSIKAITSSPVEEMYHRQLVITLDSILDARFGAGCCEEDTDTVDANTFRNRFGGTLSSMD